jgi:GTP-binding protein EngB required for normal cell division
MKRYYYAEYDYFVKKSNPGYGFCNTKKVVAFESKRERDQFVDERSEFDYTVKAVTRKYALKNKSVLFDGQGWYVGKKIAGTTDRSAYWEIDDYFNVYVVKYND